MVEGFNFRFGRGRAGDTEFARPTGAAAAASASRSVPAGAVDGEPVSSSRVRAALDGRRRGGRGRAARPAVPLRGMVGTGAKRGRTIGFPTANLGDVPTLVPGDGVYAVRALLEDGGPGPAAANVGPNPTFGEDARKIEVHLIGFAGDLYGQPMAVDFVARLRDTRPFAGVDGTGRAVEAGRRTRPKRSSSGGER